MQHRWLHKRELFDCRHQDIQGSAEQRPWARDSHSVGQLHRQAAGKYVMTQSLQLQGQSLLH